MDPASAIFSPTNADFEALPPTVKRKYFSTLERLRYAQGQLPLSPVEQPRPKTGNASKYKFVKAARFHRSSSRQPKDVTPEPPFREVTEAESAWYQSLPEKIKRNQFTFQERHQLEPKADTRHVIDPTEELFYTLGGRHANRSLPSLSSKSDGESDGSTFDEVIDTPLDAHDATFDHYQALEPSEPDASVDIVHDDYHTHLAHTAHHSRRPSTSNDHSTKRKKTVPNFSSPRFRRSLEKGRSCGDLNAARQHSISTQESSPPGLSSFGLLTPSTSDSSPRQSIFDRRASRRYGNRPEAVPPGPTIDPDATHISDPATRLKLKLYLGSAAKFDEAIEFGFPTTTTQTPPASAKSLRRGSMSSYRSARRSRSLSVVKPRNSTIIGTTFFMDDEEDDEDGATMVDDFLLSRLSSDEQFGASEEGIHTFYAELPDNITPPAAPRPSLSLPQTSHVAGRTASTLPPYSVARLPHRSQSISLKPHRLLALDTDVGQPEYTQPSMSARERPLKPWIEPANSFGEREMTLRMTLTRKDLRADESQIYPENGVGSWDAADQVAAHRNNDRWRFWHRRR